jgi:hypothetical protein
MVSDDLSFMARYGARLADNGYAVIPIMPGTKKPGRFRRGRWVDYPAWTRHCCRDTTEHEIEIWCGWPDAAVGIACSAVIGDRHRHRGRRRSRYRPGALCPDLSR